MALPGWPGIGPGRLAGRPAGPAWSGLRGPAPAPCVRLCLPPCGQPPCKGLWKALSLGDIRQFGPGPPHRTFYSDEILRICAIQYGSPGGWPRKARSVAGAGSSSRRPPGAHQWWTGSGLLLFRYFGWVTWGRSEASSRPHDDLLLPLLPCYK